MEPYQIKTISRYHQVLGIAKPEHPLVSVISMDDFKPPEGNSRISVVFDFYLISLKRNFEGSIKYTYGQQAYDFDEGVMFFIAPKQVFSFDADQDYKNSGWILLVHPDFLWGTPLAKTIRQYEFFDYSANEALFLSEKEETTIGGIAQLIKQEYHANIDKFSQGLIVAQIELLLQYCDRFYNRQFLTRKISSHQILTRVEEILEGYFNMDDPIQKGLPTVQMIADTLNISPTYLSALLKALTGQSTQQHIHEKLIEKAKEKLSLTDVSISEIAYALGFEHPPSFSKLFKSKTNLSPLDFRARFN
ncbi:helix-turn-helix transcriptional regulator [Dyadobacter chenwenxiniae]|uniref:Helix-turn-helix transcriptional regulator n=1 Tax=Dyadobacter chenwenxiniae TaxID=2906456 RepID=A0A9X1PSB6_9BACT|nr:AraC family transcriptional regulator [Dyadobacter chenwenxiniae]MCF0065570.1 helix-turn-helix transcriptional regulator [Dyadobacter chenwenxiniae]UON85481.1 helix-turn-helix transcriptional regulator [Dyadobacter chenwenxiniae]